MPNDAFLAGAWGKLHFLSLTLLDTSSINLCGTSHTLNWVFTHILTHILPFMQHCSTAQFRPLYTLDNTSGQDFLFHNNTDAPTVPMTATYTSPNVLYMKQHSYNTYITAPVTFIRAPKSPRRRKTHRGLKGAGLPPYIQCKSCFIYPYFFW